MYEPTLEMKTNNCNDDSFIYIKMLFIAAFLNRRVMRLVQKDYYGALLLKLALRKACKWWKSLVAGRGDFFLQKMGRGVFWVEKHCFIVSVSYSISM